MIAVAIFFTYSLQFYVPFEIIWKGTKHRFTSNPVTYEYLLRVILVVSTGEYEQRDIQTQQYLLKTRGVRFT